MIVTPPDLQVPLPADFQRRIVGVHGAAGEAWLAGLPAILAEAAERWSLTLLPPFDLSYNYVAPALRADGSAAVLKAGVPYRLLRNEIAALRLYDGRGAVRLLEADPDAGVFLLERLEPGTSLGTVAAEEAALAAAADLMQQLRPPPPAGHDFPTVADWAAGFRRLRARFDGGTGPLPPRLVERAGRQYDELLATSDAPVVLHGDLHHWNILAATRAPWLAIDPQGVIGEPACEVGAFLRNPFPGIAAWPDARKILARRVDLFAERLGFDRERILGWGFSQAVLSAWWAIEDHEPGGEAWIAVAELLSGVR